MSVCALVDVGPLSEHNVDTLGANWLVEYQACSHVNETSFVNNWLPAWGTMLALDCSVCERVCVYIQTCQCTHRYKHVQNNNYWLFIKYQIIISQVS